MSLYVPRGHSELNDRERTILKAVVQLFILNAAPVGSRNLSKYLEAELNLSSATIRNVMADLESWGYISHPHTSAGRTPTDLGYRVYVDSLMQLESLSRSENKIVGDLALRPRETLLRDTSKILGSLSKAIAVVRVPRFTDIIVTKIELFQLSSERILVVIALASDIVHTITLETTSPIDLSSLDQISSLINERLSGKPLRQIGEIFADMHESSTSDRSVLRLFVEHAERLSSSDELADIHVSGAQQLLAHPEFESPERLRSVIELLENEDIIIHVVDAMPESTGVSVRIGNELRNEQLADYSMVSTTYRVGSASGSISLIGPKRMNYSRIMSLVQTVGDVLSSTLHKDLP
ncbi:MAG: heat-inducible transcription repressor HrcA [Bradyrhizobiaceae bacterium]|nr:heat-inducible transcription repressor HrcA [Bradyrhizobiaceae bacterium]